MGVVDRVKNGANKVKDGVKKAVKTVKSATKTISFFFTNIIGQILGIIILCIILVIILYIAGQILVNWIGTLIGADLGGYDKERAEAALIINNFTEAGYDSLIPAGNLSEYLAFEYAVTMDVARNIEEKGIYEGKTVSSYDLSEISLTEYNELVRNRQGSSGGSTSASVGGSSGSTGTSGGGNSTPDGTGGNNEADAQGDIGDVDAEAELPTKLKDNPDEEAPKSEDIEYNASGNPKVLDYVSEIIYEKTVSVIDGKESISLTPYILINRNDREYHYYAEGEVKEIAGKYKDLVEPLQCDLLLNSQNGTIRLKDEITEKGTIRYAYDSTETLYKEEDTSLTLYKIPLKLLIDRYLPKATLLAGWNIAQSDEDADWDVYENAIKTMMNIYNEACLKDEKLKEDTDTLQVKKVGTTDDMANRDGIWYSKRASSEKTQSMYPNISAIGENVKTNTLYGYYEEKKDDIKSDKVDDIYLLSTYVTSGIPEASIKEIVNKINDSETQEDIVIYERVSGTAGGYKLNGNSATECKNRGHHNASCYKMEDGKVVYGSNGLPEIDGRKCSSVSGHKGHTFEECGVKYATVRFLTYPQTLKKNDGTTAEYTKRVTVLRMEQQKKTYVMTHLEIEDLGNITNEHTFIEFERFDLHATRFGMFEDKTTKTDGGKVDTPVVTELRKCKKILLVWNPGEAPNGGWWVDPVPVIGEYNGTIHNVKYEKPSIRDVRLLEAEETRDGSGEFYIPTIPKGTTIVQDSVTPGGYVVVDYGDGSDEVARAAAEEESKVITEIFRYKYNIPVPAWIEYNLDGSIKEEHPATSHESEPVSVSVSPTAILSDEEYYMYVIETRPIGITQEIKSVTMPMYLVDNVATWSKSVQYLNEVKQSDFDPENWRYIIPRNLYARGLSEINIREKASYRTQMYREILMKVREDDVISMLAQWESTATGGDIAAYTYMRDLYKLIYYIKDEQNNQTWTNGLNKDSYKYLYVPETILDYDDATTQKVFWMERFGTTRQADELLTQEEQSTYRNRKYLTTWQNVEYEKYNECKYLKKDENGNTVTSARVYALFPLGSPLIRAFYTDLNLSMGQSGQISSYSPPRHEGVDLFGRNNYVQIYPGAAAQDVYNHEVDRLTSILGDKESAKAKVEEELNEGKTYTPLVAVAPGKVVQVAYTANSGFRVKIQHDRSAIGPGEYKKGTTTFYMHLRRWPLVSEGEYVGAGTIIGYEGTTGGSGTHHIHFEVRKNNNKSQHPMPYIFPMFNPFYRDAKAAEDSYDIGSTYMSLYRTIILPNKKYNMSGDTYVQTAINTLIANKGYTAEQINNFTKKQTITVIDEENPASKDTMEITVPVNQMEQNSDGTIKLKNYTPVAPLLEDVSMLVTQEDVGEYEVPKAASYIKTIVKYDKMLYALPIYFDEEFINRVSGGRISDVLKEIDVADTEVGA